MDKFDEIKSDYETQRYHGDDAEYIAWFSHAEWLIAEVERLRKIEDAARDWSRSTDLMVAEKPFDALDANPRST